MEIALSGLPFCATHTTGIERYAKDMVRALLAEGCVIHLYLPYTKKLAQQLGLMKNLPPQAKIYFSKRNYKGKLQHIFWEQFVLPFCLKKLPNALFWGPGNRLPFFLPKSMKAVLTVHDLAWRMVPKTMPFKARLAAALFFSPSLKRADCVCAISKATQKDLIRLHPGTVPKTRVVYNGCSPLPANSTSSVLKKYQITQPFILNVGLIEPRKNQKRLLQAFTALPNNIRSHHQLVFVGRHGWGEDTKTLALTLGLEDQIKILPDIADQDLGFLYQQCLFLAMPSLYEGFGLPIIEAMHHGKPVLTSNTSAMPEIAGSAGLLVDPYNTESIRKGLLELTKNKALFLKLAAASKAQAKKFTWKKTAQEFKQLTQSL